MNKPHQRCPMNAHSLGSAHCPAPRAIGCHRESNACAVPRYMPQTEDHSQKNARLRPNDVRPSWIDHCLSQCPRNDAGAKPQCQADRSAIFAPGRFSLHPARSKNVPSCLRTQSGAHHLQTTCVFFLFIDLFET